MSVLRRSRQRDVILRELKNVTSHPTASEIYEMVRVEIPNISLGTVYRNLEQLVDHGSIQKLEISGKQARFDGNPEMHTHLRCAGCNKVIDVDDPPIELIQDIPDEICNHEILGLSIEYVGLCSACNCTLGPAEKRSLLNRWQ